ncbi:MAG: 50S ribosomal protein L29 [Candidatus Bathyarchaeia archaeon]
MAILRVKDIRAMSSVERKQKLLELQNELMKMKAAVKSGGAVENPGRIRELRRAIARILTVEREEQARRGRRG